MIVHGIAKDNLPVGIIKSFPEAFIVQEILKDGSVLDLKLKTHIRGFRGRSPYTLFIMTKRGLTTQDALGEVARQFNISMDCISVQGLKDKHAYTSQLISVKGKFRPRFQHGDIVLVQVSKDRRPLRPGGNAGNRFCIQVETMATDIDTSRLGSFKNYFGAQRFGRFPNRHIGRLLLEGRLEQVVDILLDDAFIGSKIRRLLKHHNGSLDKALFDNSIKRKIAFYVLQWQSYMWNELVKRDLRFPKRLPVWQPSPQIVKLYDFIWDVDPSVLHQKALSCIHKQWRQVVVEPTNIRFSQKSLGWEFHFDLPSGAYATVALSSLFQLRENR